MEPKRTDEDRRRVLERAIQVGDKLAAEEAGVSPRSLQTWRCRLGVPACRHNRRPDGTFSPGVSGNPLGLSAARRAAQEEAARQSAEVLRVYAKIFKSEAAKGAPDLNIITSLGDRILDRGLGKPSAAVEITGAEGGPVKQEITGANGAPLEREPRMGWDEWSQRTAEVLRAVGGLEAPVDPKAH